MKLSNQLQGSDEVLTAALQRILARQFGQCEPIRRIRRKRSAYASSCTIENLELQLGRGRSFNLVLKDLSPAAQLAEAQVVRPRFIYNPVPEIETYQEVLTSHRFGTAAFYGAVQRPKSQQYWLLLERVKGPMLWQVGEFDTWQSAARWLAKFHSKFDR